jgi:hypothetical protein
VNDRLPLKGRPIGPSDRFHAWPVLRVLDTIEAKCPPHVADALGVDNDADGFWFT